MTCKFSHLKFGEETTILFTGNSNCGNCGADTRELMTDKVFFYQGHSKDVDLFALKFPIKCWSCHEFITGHAEYCGDALDVTQEIKEHQKVGEND